MWRVLPCFVKPCGLHSISKCLRYNISYQCAKTTCESLSLSRNLSTSVPSLAKGFMEHENKFAHQVMERIPSYASTLIPVCEPPAPRLEDYESLLSKDWTFEKPSDVCLAFQTVSQISSVTSRPITEEVLDGLVKSLVVKQTLYTDDELLTIMQSLSLWPQTDSLNSRNYNDIWSALDNECVARIKQWDSEKLLRFADHFYNLHLLRVTKFMKLFMRKLTVRPQRLKPSQLVQFMFYVNVCRVFKPSASIYEIEYQLEKCVDTLSLDEIAILALGFFKTQTRLNIPELVTKMIRRATEEVDTVNEITLTALLKAFRFSLPLTHTDMLYELLDKLVPNVHRLSLTCCLHIALVGTNTQLFHEEILRVIAQRFVDEIRALRIKDLERIAFALTLYDFDPKTSPCIYEAIVKEYGKEERSDEMEKYPKCLPSCLHFLSLRKIFPEQLIGRTLSEEFIKTTYGSYHAKIGREILCLDTTVVIECPQYTGTRLSQELRHVLGRNHVHAIPDGRNPKRLSAAERMFLEVATTLEEMLEDSSCIYTGNVVPNAQKPDIVFAVGANDVPLVIPEVFRSVKLGDIKRPTDLGDGAKWFCIVIGGWNSYVRGSERPLGSVVMKLRQLKSIGYSPILIPWYEWTKVPATERKNYLRNYLSDQKIRFGK